MESGELSKTIKSLIKSNFPKELKNYLTDLFSYFPFPFLIVDQNFNVVLFDERFLKSIKYNLKDLLRSNLTDLTGMEIPEVRKFITEVTKKRAKPLHDLHFFDKNNKKLLTTSHVSEIRPEEGRFFFFSILNIRYPRYLDELFDSREIDEFVNKLDNRGLWSIDLKHGKFAGSEICFKLLGLNYVNSFISLPDLKELFINKEEKDSFDKGLIGVSTGSQPFSMEFRVRTGDEERKEIRILKLNCGLRNTENGEYITGSLEDITSFKKIENELLKSRSFAEKADQVKSNFLINLSHEIRTPMNAILGFSELLSHENLNKKEIDNYTSIIRSKGNYLLTLIDDVTQISQFESGKIQLNFSEFKLLPVLSELESEFNEKRIESGKSNISIELQVPDDAEKQTIYTDSGRFHQLLSNLLSNALKFTEKGKIEFGYRMSSKYFKFYVSDTGIGLSKKDQKKVFNRFEEVESTAMKRFGGTGLSLTISKYIVELMGGKIKVRSEVNKGSRFQISIPVLTVPKTSNKMSYEIEEVSRNNWKDKVILIAEDEEVNYRFLEAILQRTQAKILRARNGQEAVDLCKNISQIDLVLMDIKMPVLSGYDAIIEIKKIRSGLPIIAQTAFSSHEEIVKCQQLGVNDYVTKPIDINLLVIKINKVFNK